MVTSISEIKIFVLCKVFLKYSEKCDISFTHVSIEIL